MSFIHGSEEYYQKFIELQEKLRKSEEERLKLEMKFNEMMQHTREEEQAYYKKLRVKYKMFLDEDKKRQERNERILRSLERIETRAAMLSKKTDRFQLLRRHYQAYLKRLCLKPHQIQPVIVEEQAQGKEPTFDHAKVQRSLFGKPDAEMSPEEPKIDIMQKYFQSINSEKTKETLKEPIKSGHYDSQQYDKVPYSARTYDEHKRSQIYGKDNYNFGRSVADDILDSIHAKRKKLRESSQSGDVWDKWKSPSEKKSQQNQKQLSKSVRSLRKSLDDLNSETDDKESVVASASNDYIPKDSFGKKPIDTVPKLQGSSNYFDSEDDKDYIFTKPGDDLNYILNKHNNTSPHQPQIEPSKYSIESKEFFDCLDFTSTTTLGSQLSRHYSEVVLQSFKYEDFYPKDSSYYSVADIFSKNSKIVYDSERQKIKDYLKENEHLIIKDYLKTNDDLKSKDYLKITNGYTCKDFLEDLEYLKNKDYLKNNDPIKSINYLKDIGYLKSSEHVKNCDPINSINYLKYIDYLKSKNCVKDTIASGKDILTDVKNIDYLQDLKNIDGLKTRDSLKSKTGVNSKNNFKPKNSFKSKSFVPSTEFLKPVEKSKDCEYLNLNFSNFDYSKSDFSQLPNFAKSDASTPVYSKLKLINSEFSTPKLLKSDFSTSKLIKSDSSTSKIPKSNFSTSKLLKSDFSTSRLVKSDFSKHSKYDCKNILRFDHFKSDYLTPDCTLKENSLKSKLSLENESSKKLKLEKPSTDEFGSVLEELSFQNIVAGETKLFRDSYLSSYLLRYK